MQPLKYRRPSPELIVSVKLAGPLRRSAGLGDKPLASSLDHTVGHNRLFLRLDLAYSGYCTPYRGVGLLRYGGRHEIFSICRRA